MRGLVVLVLCLSLGLQWIALQGIAWTGMLISFARDGSLTEAVAKTFDGAHPCPLCKMVKKGIEAEQEPREGQPPPSKTKEMKLTLALVSFPRFVFPPVVPRNWITTSSAATTRHERPVTPPPKLG